MTLAAADVGTNSCRLLIAEIIDGKLITLFKKVVSTRLGEGVAESGWLHPEAISRTVDCLLNFRDIIAGYRCEWARVVATSAVREAANRDDFLAVAEADTGLKVEVISGSEEAQLSYLGVLRGLDFEQPPLVVDMGGGSTEFIIPGQPGGIFTVRVGAVNATEAELSAAEMWSRLEEVLALGRAARHLPLAAVGGTPTTLVAIKEGLAEYDPDLVHGHRLSRQDVAELYAMLEAMPLGLRRRLPGLQPERADIIVKGALLLLVIMEGLQRDSLVVSESDLLEGIIWQRACDITCSF
ncbi:MAG: Ppx/GppA phosphatase family protein [Syntrophomonadaceae bacterium]|jgi:exopolyphosphatase/guanosine-5'-triphosphate,3'-diphosphate pyrophosphatase|nr:Ppx/GppA phosphatase family protein [Syntrophomonadaceae bacterium]